MCVLCNSGNGPQGPACTRQACYHILSSYSCFLNQTQTSLLTPEHDSDFIADTWARLSELQRKPRLGGTHWSCLHHSFLGMDKACYNVLSCLFLAQVLCLCTQSLEGNWGIWKETTKVTFEPRLGSNHISKEHILLALTRTCFSPLDFISLILPLCSH